MLRIDIPDIEISAETEKTIRSVVASRGIPGGAPADKFLYHPQQLHEVTVWSDSLMEAARSVFRLAIGLERKRVARLRGLANLDQALRLIRQEVNADQSIRDEDKAHEAMRRAYQVGKGHAELEVRHAAG